MLQLVYKDTKMYIPKDFHSLLRVSKQDFQSDLEDQGYQSVSKGFKAFQKGFLLCSLSSQGGGQAVCGGIWDLTGTLQQFHAPVVGEMNKGL